WRLEAMDQLNFTSEEKRFLRRIAGYRRGDYVFFYACILLGPIVFGIYGFLRHDAVPIIVAFLGLLGIELWLISHSVRDSKLLSSICARLLALDKGSGERK